MTADGLAGKTAFVTGASEGIGRGLALALAAAGAHVVVSSRRADRLHDVLHEIEQHGGRAQAMVMDVTDIDSIRHARDRYADQVGGLDVLVNSAGYSVNRPAWDLDERDWDTIIDTGLKGLFFCCQILGSLMREQRHGSIINLSSTLSSGVVPGASAYATCKAAVSHLTRALAVEWAPDGVRVNAIAPGATPTPSRRSRQTPQHRQALIDRIPLGRLGDVADLVPVALYLAGADSDFVTGQTLYVDGGWTAA
jgi:2-deoxy-D-gluconate 3-dehydrogenase